MTKIPKDQSLTKKVLLGSVVGLLAYEFYTIYDQHRDGDTISETVWDSIKNRPYIPFFSGLLMGHFFWQRGK